MSVLTLQKEIAHLQEKIQQLEIDYDILDQDNAFKQKIIETLDKEIESLKKEGEKNWASLP